MTWQPMITDEGTDLSDMLSHPPAAGQDWSCLQDLPGSSIWNQSVGHVGRNSTFSFEAGPDSSQFSQSSGRSVSINTTHRENASPHQRAPINSFPPARLPPSMGSTTAHPPLLPPNNFQDIDLASWTSGQAGLTCPSIQASAAPSSTTPVGPPGGGLHPERSGEGHRLIVVQTLVGKSHKWVTETLKTSAAGNEICNLGNHPRDCPVQLLWLGNSPDNLEDGGGPGMAGSKSEGKGRAGTERKFSASAPSGTVASLLEKADFCMQPFYLKSGEATECWEPLPLPANGSPWASELDSRSSKWLSAVEKHRKMTEYNVIAAANLDLSKLRSAGESLEPVGSDQKEARKCRQYRLRISWTQGGKEVSAETQSFHLWRSSTPASAEGSNRNKRRRMEDGSSQSDNTPQPQGVDKRRNQPLDNAHQRQSSDDFERLRQCADLVNFSALFEFVKGMLPAARRNNSDGVSLRNKLRGDFPFALDTHSIFSSRVKTGRDFDPIFTLSVQAVASNELANILPDNTGHTDSQDGTPHGGNASGGNHPTSGTPSTGQGPFGGNMSYSNQSDNSESRGGRGHSTGTPGVITDTESEAELASKVEECFSPPPEPAERTGNEPATDSEMRVDAVDQSAARPTDVEPSVFEGSCHAEQVFEDAMEATCDWPRFEHDRCKAYWKGTAGKSQHNVDSAAATAGLATDLIILSTGTHLPSPNHPSSMSSSSPLFGTHRLQPPIPSSLPLLHTSLPSGHTPVYGGSAAGGLAGMQYSPGTGLATTQFNYEPTMAPLPAQPPVDHPCDHNLNRIDAHPASFTSCPFVRESADGTLEDEAREPRAFSDSVPDSPEEIDELGSPPLPAPLAPFCPNHRPTDLSEAGTPLRFCSPLLDRPEPRKPCDSSTERAIEKITGDDVLAYGDIVARPVKGAADKCINDLTEDSQIVKTDSFTAAITDSNFAERTNKLQIDPSLDHLKGSGPGGIGSLWIPTLSADRPTYSSDRPWLPTNIEFVCLDPTHQHLPSEQRPHPPYHFRLAGPAAAQEVLPKALVLDCSELRNFPVGLGGPTDTDAVSTAKVRSLPQTPATFLDQPLRWRPILACKYCRLRKLRCTTAPGPCDHCVRQGKKCVFESTSTRTRKSGDVPKTTELAHTGEGAPDMASSVNTLEESIGLTVDRECLPSRGRSLRSLMPR